jgi:hypothetical protein
MNWFFVLFLVSGFCGLVYEVVPAAAAAGGGQT